MNVLCVNHAGEVSGAERSLLDLMSGLRDDLNVRLACPSGPLAGAARERGIPVDPILGTAGSLRLHVVHTPVAVARMTAAAMGVHRHARQMRADIVHANSIRAGLFSVPAARLSRVSSVVHVRDRLPRSRVADGSLKLIADGADVVAANSRYTADGIRLVSASGKVRVVYNPVDLARFDPSSVDRAAARDRLGVPQSAFVTAVIGQITPWKGQLDAVRMLSLVRLRHRDVHLLIVGEPKFVSAATRYDNRGYYAELRRVIEAERVIDRVHLLGERDNVPEIMGSLDALLVPSWEEPFGRVVVEAMAMGLPVLATTIGGPAEIIHDDVDGILLRPRRPELWADALVRVIGSEDVRTSLGDGARRRACDFALESHVRAMREVYEDAVDRRRTPEPRVS